MNETRELLERVGERFAFPERTFERLERRRDRKRRNKRITAGAVGVAVFVMAVWIVTLSGTFDGPPTPAVTGSTVPPASTRVGFIGLPPEGATASTPQHGQLVLSFEGRSIVAGESLSHVFVYADGRLIWQREGDWPEGANALTTGFLEQRLTPGGVELLRSEIISTRLFDHDLALVNKQSPWWFWGTIQVRDGDRFVRVDWDESVQKGSPIQEGGSIATSEQANALERVDELLTDPASWLPASAWDDREIRAYVPSRYAVCYMGLPQPIDPSRILTLLPAPAEEMLRAEDRTRGGVAGSEGYCSDVTTEGARTLAEAFDEAGNESGGQDSNTRLTYRIEAPSHAPVREVYVFFEPYLPDGEVICSACG